MDNKKMTPMTGEDMKGMDPIMRMMERAERGDRSMGTLKGARPEGKGMIRPFQMPPRSDQMPPSKAPRGMANAVEGDIGAYRQQEAKKVFGDLPGKDESNPLRYRKPETAIDAKFGPGDKVA